MSDDSPEDRPRPRSFRIDDILACTETTSSTSTSTTSTNTSTSSSSDGASGSVTSTSLRTPCVVPLNFGVDSLLSRNTRDMSPTRYESYYPVIPGGYWSPPYTCYTGGHSCNTCYNYSNASYMTSTKLSAHPEMYLQYTVQQPTTDSQQYSQDPSNTNKTARRPRRPWTRAVFSSLQRKGLEKRFQVQKYLTKADRHQLASMLGLSDNQVKVWFQNRRMKWRQDARESVTSTNTEGGEESTN